jgi:hypothetical protein
MIERCVRMSRAVVGLVEDDELRLEHQRERYENALLHPAGELVRERRQHALRVEVDEVEQLVRTVADLLSILHSVRACRVEELLPDRDHRVERVERGLEHHRGLGPAVFAEIVVVQLSDVGREPVLRVEDLALRDLGAAWR